MLDFELNKPYTVEIAPHNDRLDSDWFLRLQEYLDNLGMNRIGDLVNACISWKDPQELEFMEDPSGASWLKRFQRRIYDMRGAKLNDAELSTIGNYIAQSTRPINSYFQFSKHNDWKPGDFGERNNTSCWWTDFNSCRLGLVEKEQGFSVLYYKDEAQFRETKGLKGIGRHWLWNDEKYSLIFNAYGISLSDAARSIAKIFEVETKKVRMESPGAYINNGNKNNINIGEHIAGGGSEGWAWYLGKGHTIRNIYEIMDFRKTDGLCANCSNKIFLLESIGIKRRTGTAYICKGCYDTHSIKCQNCGSRGLESDYEILHNSKNNRRSQVCFTCIERYAHTCIVHGKHIGDEIRVFHTSRMYCATCFRERDICQCSQCTRISDDYVIIGNQSLCTSCYNKLISGKEKRYGYKNRL